MALVSPIIGKNETLLLSFDYFDMTFSNLLKYPRGVDDMDEVVPKLYHMEGDLTIDAFEV
jgi:hypothetical protein